MRTIATYCLHGWECTDVPGVFSCKNCDAMAEYNRDTKIYWIED